MLASIFMIPALTIMAENIDQAAEGEGAICQDTGLPTFEIKVPVGANQMWMAQQIRDAVAEATRRGKPGRWRCRHTSPRCRVTPRVRVTASSSLVTVL